jgi:DNA-binding SARP family transcriptional activator
MTGDQSQVRVAPQLKFAVLGPVRAWREDTELDLGAPQQRALLAMLLLAGGHQVTLDALISGLWDYDPPLAAAGTVRTYVSRLRHSLGGRGRQGRAGLIESKGTGYVLPTEARALDLETFDRLTNDARTLMNRSPAGNAQAAAMFRDALRLGQGEPLADLPGPYAQLQRQRITDLQLAAAEERLALDIQLGSHVIAVAELQTLLASHPMREKLSELLMLALYRSGRQIDALAVYESTRRLLSEEFGVDPGSGLREMQQRILRTDEALLLREQPPHGTDADPDASPGPRLVASSSPVVMPAQLPGGLPVFAARHRELARLRSFLGDTTKSGAAVTIAAINGMAGIGKTTLAVHWAHEVASQFPDGHLYVDLRGFSQEAVRTPGEVLSGFLGALGVAPADVPEQVEARASLYRSMLYGRRILVLLDNAHDLEQVRPLLPSSPGCLTIVTSRNRLIGLAAAHGAHTLTLEPLPPGEAREVLSKRIEATRLAAEPRAVDEIIDCCAGLPLALAVVAARANLYGHSRLSEVTSELRDTRTRMNALSTDDVTADVRTIFSWSYQLLSGPARRLFRLLSVHCGPDISRSAAASLAGLTRAEVQPLVAELTGTQLLTEHRPGRFSWHDLTQAYAAELSAAHDTLADRHAALGRLLDHYLHTSYAAHVLLQPHVAAPEPDAPRPGVTPEELADYQQAMAWFAAERQVLLAVVCHAAQPGYRRQAWQLALTLQTFYDRQGYVCDWATTTRFALRAAIAVDREAWKTAATIHYELGLPSATSVHRQLRRLDELVKHCPPRVARAAAG